MEGGSKSLQNGKFIYYVKLEVFCSVDPCLIYCSKALGQILQSLFWATYVCIIIHVYLKCPQLFEWAFHMCPLSLSLKLGKFHN